MTTTYLVAKPITHSLRTEREYRAAIKEIDALLDHGTPDGSPEYDRLDLLSVLVESYENERGIDLPDPSPQEIIDFMLDQRGMTRAELAPIMGGRSRVSDFFARKRRLSVAQIVVLRDTLGIPADLLIERSPDGERKHRRKRAASQRRVLRQTS